MVLIADSGSTKTNWRLLDNYENAYQFNTIGFNPYFQDASIIENELKQNLLPQIEDVFSSFRREPLEIFFYGAGCSSLEKCSLVKNAIASVFEEAKVEVEHDLLAAARALCGKEEGIAAIMGTGSNSCYYNGEEIVENITSLGFILGDEGSGAYLGKHFLQDYLNNEVPEKVHNAFTEKYKLSKEAIFDGIYKKSMPSKFLASFSRFISEHSKEEYFTELVDFSFNQFFTKHICKYANHKEVKMSCVGSVAYYYGDTLRSIASKRGVSIDKIIESPIRDLAVYHSKMR
jgi:glucosamine kinase